MKERKKKEEGKGKRKRKIVHRNSCDVLIIQMLLVHGSSDRRVSPFRFVFPSTSGLSEDGENRAGRSVFVSRFKIPSGALQGDSQYEGITGNRGRYRKKNNGVCTGDLPVVFYFFPRWNVPPTVSSRNGIDSNYSSLIHRAFTEVNLILNRIDS